MKYLNLYNRIKESLLDDEDVLVNKDITIIKDIFIKYDDDLEGLQKALADNADLFGIEIVNSNYASKKIHFYIHYNYLLNGYINSFKLYYCPNGKDTYAIKLFSNGSCNISYAWNLVSMSTLLKRIHCRATKNSKIFKINECAGDAILTYLLNNKCDEETRSEFMRVTGYVLN